MEIKLKRKKTQSGYYKVQTSTGMYLGAFELDMDGFYYFCCNSSKSGCWGSNELRLIADKLDEVNKPYNDSLNEYFKNRDNTGDLTLDF